MHLHQLLGWPGPMTARQYRAWQGWLANEWNEPSRTDHYLMQIAQKIVSVNRRKGQSAPKLDKLKIPFKMVTRVVGAVTQASKEAAAKISKMVWMGRVGADDTYTDSEGRTRLKIQRKNVVTREKR